MAVQNELGWRPGGSFSQLNITAATTVKAEPGTLCSISVLVAGSGTGKASDAAAVADVAAGNLIGVIPNSVTDSPLIFNWPCAHGVTITPGTGQTLAVAWR